jgi:hypothetical protein
VNVGTDIETLEAERDRLEEASYVAGEDTWDDIMEQIDEIDDELDKRREVIS